MTRTLRALLLLAALAPAGLAAAQDSLPPRNPANPAAPDRKDPSQPTKAPLEDGAIIPAGPVGVTYNITLKVQDTTGQYTDSAPFTVPFQSVPEPAALTLITLASPLFLRRGRC